VRTCARYNNLYEIIASRYLYLLLVLEDRSVGRLGTLSSEENTVGFGLVLAFFVADGVILLFFAVDDSCCLLFKDVLAVACLSFLTLCPLSVRMLMDA
jgi:hypothetical protein